MSNKHIVIQIDTNSVVRNSGKIKLLLENVKYFSLKEEMKIKVYMENEIWDAMVHRDITEDIENQWYIDIIGESDIMTDEQLEFMELGYNNGICRGKFHKEIEIAEKMLELGIDLITVSKIVNLSEKRLKIMFNRISNIK